MEKESLAHWNFAIDFTAMEAAALALGLDPLNVDGQPPEKTIIRPVYERMRDDFEQAVMQMEVAPTEVAEKGFLPGSLVSTRLEHIYCVDHIMWLLEDVALKRPQSRFERQRFSRGAIHRWMDEIDMPSVYAFVPSVTETENTRGEWPWGTHNTEALGQLEAAASISSETRPHKPLTTRERNTLLTIIAALCKEAKLDPAKPAKTAGYLRGIMAQMGVDVGESTIESHLKKIPEALQSRST